MPIAWFLAPYRRRLIASQPDLNLRYCGLDDYTTLVDADGGRWAEIECLGNYTIVKVRASAGTLTTIANDPDIARLPKTLLNDPLSDLTTNQKTAIRDKLQALGYPLAEIQADLGVDIGSKTLRDVLKFVLKRRSLWVAPYFDGGGAFVLSGEAAQDRTPDELDPQVP